MDFDKLKKEEDIFQLCVFLGSDYLHKKNLTETLFSMLHKNFISMEQYNHLTELNFIDYKKCYREVRKIILEEMDNL